MTDAAPQPQGVYVPATRHGDLVFTAGMTPRQEGRMLYEGPVRRDTPLDDMRAAAELACANALWAVRSKLLRGEQIEKIVNLNIFITADTGFARHSQIADFASSYLRDAIGTAAIGARAAVGVASLPGNAPLEIRLVAAVRPKEALSS